MPAVVFLTAYEEHALRAFRVNAIDYLLKPIDADELRGSLERARLRLVQKDSRAAQFRDLLGSLRGTALLAPERIVVRTGGRVHLLEPREILWIEASGDYVTLHTADKDHLVRESMRNMQSRLAEHGFRRIHRSALVKLDAIRELVATDSGDGVVLLHDGTELKLSRTYRNALYSELNVDS